MSTFNPQRTFIHEIGHFIARELNKSIFKIGLGVEEIYITGKENLFSSKKGSGGTKPKKQNEYFDDKIVYNPEEFVAVLLYGCLFQSIYFKTGFNDCFAMQDYANGARDAQEFISLQKYISGKKRKMIIEYFSIEYIDDLKSNSEHFKIINRLKYEDFVLCIRDGDYIIDVEKLRNELIEFFIVHELYYKKLIHEIKKINNS